ncbi:MAG TPA: ATP-binding cassette domain-containing protein [Thermoanaerobaculia bacterium]
MIELDLALPLARFTLRVSRRLSGRAVAILGASGSGKTSLLESIAGLRAAATGRIAIDGEVLLDTRALIFLPPERRRIGYVPQDALLFPHLTVERNVRFGSPSGEGAEVVDRLFREAVTILEIDRLLARFPSTLSGGERQRVALARAIAARPRLLLLDEPLAAVDVALKGRILPYLLRVRDELHVPFLYVTHNAGEARAVAEEAVVLREGAVVFAGAPEQALEWVSQGDPEARFDNIFAGTLEAPPGSEGVSRGTRVGVLRVGESRLVVPMEAADPASSLAVFAVSPEDVLVSSRPLVGISARNVLPGAVVTLEIGEASAWARILAQGIEWNALVTKEAARELELAPGRPAWIAVKTHVFRRLR